jgi:hypothetical protein
MAPDREEWKIGGSTHKTLANRAFYPKMSCTAATHHAKRPQHRISRPVVAEEPTEQDFMLQLS